VKVVDANLLLYAVDERSPRHAPARAWLEGALSGGETVGLAWVVLLAFIRVSTRASVFEHPLEVGEALDLVDGWLAQPCTTVLEPSPRHHKVLRELLEPLGSAGNITSDAHLAAIAVEHGADLYSCDRDFARFNGVRWRDPLAEMER
jgi:uncharacterized protein